MAKNNNRNPYAFTPIVLDQETHEKRRVIKQLPAVHQTETLQKFFGATADHLFDPGKGKAINGYVGQKPLWYDPDQDYYLEENNGERTFYQLEAGMVSKNSEGQLTDVLPYADLINQLRFQGALTNNHNRLFSQDFYTWCPPIDLDKIVNFRQYVWLPIDDVAPTSTFEDGQADGWLLQDGTPAPVGGPFSGLNKFLGPFAGTPTAEEIVSKTFTLNSNITTTGLQLDFIKLNSWDSIPGMYASPQAYGPESIFVYLNNQVAFKFTPVDIQGLGGSSLGSGTIDLGDIQGTYNVTSPGQDSQLDTGNTGEAVNYSDRIYRISISLTGTGKTLKLGFGSNTDENIGNESMGIDNVRVFQSSKTGIEINGPTVKLVSPGNTTTYWLPGYGPDGDADLQKFYDLNLLTSSLIHAEVDGESRTFQYATGQQTITFDQRPAADADVSISVYSDLENNAIGLPKADAKAFGGVQLSSGMRIKVRLDKNTDYKRDDVYIVERVGRQIELIKEVESFAGAAPDYMIIERGAPNANEWSTRNRWFHVSTLPDTMDPDYVLSHRATRPIIEFNRELELFQYGLHRRLDVDMVVETLEDLNGYLNQNPTNVVLNGVPVTAIGGGQIRVGAVNPDTGTTYGDVTSIRLMVRNTINSLLNDNIFVLVNQGGVLKLILETDGENPSGTPEYGEVFKVRLGSYSGKNLYWNGAAWVQSQLKTKINQAPLFELYDLNGNNLRDEGLYPNSTFKGSRLFSYKIDDTGTRVADQVLRLPLVHDNKGQILFENFLSTEDYQYVVGGKFINITGFYFHRDTVLDTFSNDWFKAPGQTRQFMIDRYVADGRTRLFNVSQDAQDLEVTLGRVNESKSFERTLLVEDRDFIRVDRQIMLLDVQKGDVIEFRTFSTKNPPLDAKGHYEIPLNLQANPDNAEVDSMTKGDFYDHFSEIMKKQAGFTGAEYSANNYRDTAKVLNLGTHVIQHSAGLLKTMLLASTSQLDLMSAIRFSESEYARFKEKFQQKILDYTARGKLANAASYDTWINTALEELNKGKTKHFAFYLSGMAQSEVNKLPTFIPPTPSFLGVYPLYAPELIPQEVEGADAVWFVRGHDGSLTQGQSETCARVLHALEIRIFNSVANTIRLRERPACDFQVAHGDQFRSNDYTYAEYLQILRPSFERWTVNYRQDSRINDSYLASDPWTWNWSSIPTSTGDKVPGHWRGIYEKFFGTQRPDMTPWEALGFSIKPDWWDDRYGPAPYTSENLVLWDDLEQGYIHSGPRQGINKAWARPGLKAHLPVDMKGRLRHPGPRDLVALDVAGEDLLFLGQGQPEDYYTAWEDAHDEGVLGCNICPTIPLYQERAGDWEFGDMGPVEQTWRRSSNFAYAVAGASYLMKPAAFVELGWNTQDSGLFFEGTANEQWLNQDTKGRPQHRELQVHGEVLEDLSLVTKIGVQQWVSDLLANRNTEINSNFADKVRGLGSQLNYKVGGFTDATTLVTVSDAFGRVPSEDVTISLYRSPSIREETYSGVAVEYTGRGYEVFGYDTLNPYFGVIAAAQNGNKISVGNGATSAAVPSWKSNTYYSVGITVKYQDAFYRSTRTHTSATLFEDEFWTKVARPQYADGTALTWYLDAELDAQVEKVAYGTVFKTPQEVANFLNSYERYLKSRGWVFENVAEDVGEVRDWRSALKSFITWSNNGDREPGDYLALSPCAGLVKFSTDHGAIQPVEQIINGLYAIVDQQGQPIDNQLTRVVRNDGDISVSCNATQSGIFGLRLYISELEHVLVFNNQTIFGDTIYSPLLNIKQPRLRLQGFKTVGWKGRVDAPGFIVTGDTLTPNFERAADDFRRFFEIESMENKKLQDRARANFGYEEREYLNNLLLTPTNQFEFYQGMIQQKGSTTAMRRLLRSNFIRHNKGLKLFEEWAFRVGNYGGQEVQPSLDIQIRQSEFQHNPQLIKFTNAGETNTYGVINVVDTQNPDSSLANLDPRWHWRPDMATIEWPLTDYPTAKRPKSLPPVAGYVNLDEVRFTVRDSAAFEDLYGQKLGTDDQLKSRDRVWVYGIGEGEPDASWMTYKFHDTTYGIVNAFRPSFDDQGTVVQLNKPVNGYTGGASDPWNSTFFVTQPLLESTIDASGLAYSGERLMFENLKNSDINQRQTYRPKYGNSARVTLTATSGSETLIMGFYPEAQQVVKTIKIFVDSAFTPGSSISIGHDSDLDAFVGMNAVDLTKVGAYEFPQAFNTVNAGPNRNMIASLANNGILGSLRVQVDYYYVMGFELVENLYGSFAPAVVNEDGGTAEIFTWVKTRYPTLNIPGVFETGDLIEVDSAHDTPGRWAVYKKVASEWTIIRRQNRKINTDLLTNAAIFNSVENKLKLILQPYDPYKGFIPGVADRELEFKTFDDPAVYSDGLMVWGKEQVGMLWWDLSAVRYLDYEIYDDLSGGVNYRWKNWGRVAPNSTVDVYEWTRSPVAPNGWADYVESKAALKVEYKPSGTVLETSEYVMTTEWNDDTGVEQTIYYFWVKNPTVVPGIPSRKLSAMQISNVITNPTANDIPFIALIDTNKVIVGGIKQFLNETDTVLKVKWTKETEIINNHHKQWIILREEDERNTINDTLWAKMRDSLVGWDATQAQVPDPRLPAAQQIGALVRPRQSWFPADASPNTGQRPSRSARAAYVDIMNDIFAAQPFADQWAGWEEVFTAGEDMPTADRYVMTALDLADLQNLLPASRNMVQPGECVLIQNTTEASGFWTLWKLVDNGGQRSFILEDFQKWRMQEGELWNLADWYADGWSARNFPNYRFATYADRTAAGNLDVTLLKGTLVQIDEQSPSDKRWSWDVYTSTTKYQVAKAKSTMKLSDAFYDDTRTEFGPKQVAAVLGTPENARITPARIQELADMINYRDGSREIEFMLNSFKTRLFDTLQKNRLFFSTVKSAFKQTQVVDWAFKTSFLYLGGYSETLRQSPVAFKDQIDNVISYLEEVKPYHVKIREYVRRLSYGPDLADLAMTDFDKPVYPDGQANRILDPQNPTDRNIMGNQRPWKDWFENYENEPKGLEDWDLDWNGVRKMNIKMKFDRISCGTVHGWDTSPWDPSLLVYSQKGGTTQSLSQLSNLYRNRPTGGVVDYYKDQTVETIEERNYLVRKNIVIPERPGTIVTVLQTGEHFMWSGNDWIKFEAIGWDQDPDMGAATRIYNSYRPLPGMTRKDDAGLIAGCEFDGTVITDQFVNDDWDIFEWDSTGLSMGQRERTGRDADKIDGNSSDPLISGNQNIKIPEGNKVTDFVVRSAGYKAVDGFAGVRGFPGAHRSYGVYQFNNSNEMIGFNTFDVYGAGEIGGTAADMAAYLNGIVDGTTVIVVSQDEPANLHLESGLDKAMARIGAGATFLTDGYFKFRSAYILLGKAGIGQGGGQEFYKGSVGDSPENFIDINITMVDGVPYLNTKKSSGSVSDSDIKVTGNQFSQPAVNGERPHELVQIRGIESIVINVKKSSGLYQKSFMNAVGKWQDTMVVNSGATLVEWDQNNHSLSMSGVNWSEDAQGFTGLHDPQNPSTGYIRDVVLSKGYRSTSNIDMTTPGTKTFKLRDVQEVNGIPAGLRGSAVKVAVVNTQDPTKRAIGTLSPSRGSESGWNGSVTITFDDGFVNIGSGKGWNIIPVDLFNEPGVVWIGNARFTYTEVERGTVTVLRNAKLSASSLSSLNITDDGVSLKDTGPVVDGSLQRRKS